GDVCVAFVVPLCTRSPSSQSDASVPSPHDPTPAPTGTKRLPRRYHEIPTCESPTPAPTKVTIGPKLPTPVSQPLRVRYFPPNTYPCEPLPLLDSQVRCDGAHGGAHRRPTSVTRACRRSEEHTSELQSLAY